MFKKFSRAVVTPVTVVLFVVSTVTGIMLLTHWNAGLVRFSHEWLSMAFSAIALWHLARNWGTFVGYLKRHAALTAFAVSLAISLGVTGLTGTSSAASPGAVFRALSNSRLEVAAPAFGLAPVDAVALLRTHGIDAANDDTLAEIGSRSHLGGAGVASLLAMKERR